MSYNELQQKVLNYLEKSDQPIYLRWYLPQEEIESIMVEDFELFEAALMGKIIDKNQEFIQAQTLEFLAHTIIGLGEQDTFNQLSQTEIEDLLMYYENHANLRFFDSNTLCELHQKALKPKGE